MKNKINFILGAVVFLLLGFLAGLLLGRTIMGVGEITFSDGKTLEVRLNELEETLNEVKKSASSADETLQRITKPPDKRKNRPDPDKKYDFDLSNVPWKGAANPKVTIIKFSDFQCPYCKKMAGVLDDLLEQYPNDIRLYFKTRLIHQSALPAHEAALAANEQGKFWEMYDILFANMKNQTPEDLEKYAGEIGLNIPKFKMAMTEHQYGGLVKKDDEEAKRNLINSTPTVFINGYYQPKLSPDVIKQKVEEAIKGGP